MMLPVFIVAGLVNLLANKINYNVNIASRPDFDLRVRRDIDTPKELMIDGNNLKEGNNIKKEFIDILNNNKFDVIPKESVKSIESDSPKKGIIDLLKDINHNTASIEPVEGNNLKKDNLINALKDNNFDVTPKKSVELEIEDNTKKGNLIDILQASVPHDRKKRDYDLLSPDNTYIDSQNKPQYETTQHKRKQRYSFSGTIKKIVRSLNIFSKPKTSTETNYFSDYYPQNSQYYDNRGKRIVGQNGATYNNQANGNYYNPYNTNGNTYPHNGNTNPQANAFGNNVANNPYNGQFNYDNSTNQSNGNYYNQYNTNGYTNGNANTQSNAFGNGNNASSNPYNGQFNYDSRNSSFPHSSVSYSYNGYNPAINYNQTATYDGKNSAIPYNQLFNTTIPNRNSTNNGNGYNNFNYGNGYNNLNYGNSYTSLNNGNGYNSLNSGNGYTSLNNGNGYTNTNNGNEYTNFFNGNDYTHPNTGNRNTNSNNGSSYSNSNNGSGFSLNNGYSTNLNNGNTNQGKRRTTTERIEIATSCVLCATWSCPEHQRRVGFKCVPDDYDY